jgi:hypothetical protein
MKYRILEFMKIMPKYNSDGKFQKYGLCYCLIMVLLVLGCTSSDEKSSVNQKPWTQQNWIEDRVNATKERMEDSPAGKKVWQAMEAHGGLANWYSNGPLQFHFNYQPLDGNTPRNTIQISDNWSAKARHQMATDTSLQFGWNGEEAWALPDPSKIPFDARFWALTPYYFVGIPFVLGDEGVKLEEVGQDNLDGITYDLIKVTFGEGVGDAPDDFYVVYLHLEPRQVAAYRYVVSYPAYFPDGGHTPEKIMILDGEQIVDGILFPEGYRTFMWKDESPGEHVTDVQFLPGISPHYFSTPSEAEVIAEEL